MLTDQQESSFLEMLIFLEADRRRILNYMLDTSPSPFLFSLSFVSLSHQYADTLLITSLAPCFLEYSAVIKITPNSWKKGWLSRCYRVSLKRDRKARFVEIMP